MGIVLEYQPQLRRPFPWRKVFRYGLRAAIIGAIVAAGWYMIPPAYRYYAAKAERQRLFNACLEYVPPRGVVVFDQREWLFSTLPLPIRGFRWSEDPVAPPETERPTMPLLWWFPLQDSIRNSWPHCWGTFDFHKMPMGPFPWSRERLRCRYGIGPSPYRIDLRTGMSVGSYSAAGIRRSHFGYEHRSSDSLLYMHRRAIPSGEGRFVMITFDGPAFASGFEDVFYAQVRSTDASDGESVRITRLSCEGFPTDWFPPVKIYAGQSDPVDASRFRIPFTAGARNYCIEGRLDDSDRVTLKAVAVQP